MILWKSTRHVIRRKMAHVRKINGKWSNGFCEDWGDVPVARYNEQTNCWEAVDNGRGNAYGLRRALRYRSR